MEFPPCPASLKQIQHFLKIAQEHDTRDIVVSYWSRLYALQIGLKASTQQSDETALLLGLMDWLETVKKEHADNESITNEIAAQAHLENYALKLFSYADKQDRDGNFGKNVVKAFYSSGVIYDILQTFGTLTDEVIQNRKYAKWKAAYIHNCLKNGEIPVAGPMQDVGGDDDDDGMGGENNIDPNITAVPQDPSPDENSAGADEYEPRPQPIDPSPPSRTPPTVDEVLNNPDKLPNPPVDEEKPGGFEAYVPPAQPNSVWNAPTPVENFKVTPDQMLKAQKYCKYASSALNYDDVKTAVENLQKALVLLTTGEDN